MVKCAKVNSFQPIGRIQEEIVISAKSKLINKSRLQNMTKQDTKEMLKNFCKVYQENRQSSQNCPVQSVDDSTSADTASDNGQQSQNQSYPVLNGHFKLLRELGEGGTSKVYLAQSLKTDKKYAIKIVKSDFLNNQQAQLNIIKNEIMIMRKLNHKNMIQLIDQGGNGTIINPSGHVISNLIYLVLEYSNGGLLFDLVKGNNDQGFGEDSSKYLLSQLLDFLQYSHAQGVTHRDLKLENILLDQDMNIKVTDFGGADTTNISCPNHLIGTISYMAPEIFAQITYDGRKVDIFALGVLLTILVKGTMPFRCAKVDDPYYRMLIMRQNDLYWSKVQGSQYSQDFKDLIQQMLSLDPAQRPSIEQIKSHPWMQTMQNIDEQKQKLMSLRKPADLIAQELEISQI